MIDIIGYIAGFLTSTASFHQLAKIIRLKRHRSVSLNMYLSLGSGCFLWIWYGITLKSVPIILTNLVAFVPICAIIGFKLLNRR